MTAADDLILASIFVIASVSLFGMILPTLVLKPHLMLENVFLRYVKVINLSGALL